MDKSNNKTVTLDSIIVRSKSVLSLPAQNTSLCDRDCSSDKQLESFISKVVECTWLSATDKGIMLLCLTEGLRISEALGILADDWRAGQKVFIRGKKGSFDRVVSVRFFFTELRSFTFNYGCLGVAGNRFYFYREFKKLGIIFQSSNSSRSSVTHAGRHLLADNLFQHGNDIELSQRTLGHKSVNSTKHYVEVKQNKKRK
jgi:site-specific recombinase XerD